MNTSTAKLMHRGMTCLIENMGALEAQRFISAVLREQFDYIQWRHDFFDNMTPEEFESGLLEWSKTRPGITGNYATDPGKDSA